MSNKTLAVGRRWLGEVSADKLDQNAYPPMFFSAALVTGTILLIAVVILGILLQQQQLGVGSEPREKRRAVS